MSLRERNHFPTNDNKVNSVVVDSAITKPVVRGL